MWSLRFLAAAAVAAIALPFATVATDAALTHALHNLNLHSGPGKHYRVSAVIPIGAPIDIHSCGREWCHVGWAGRSGYVNKHLVGHVTAAASPSFAPEFS